MTIYAEVVGNGIELSSTYRDKELMRAIPGSRFHSPPPIWTVPLSWAACKQLRGTFGDRLELGPALVEWATSELADRIQASLDLRDKYDSTRPLLLPPPAGTLFPYQLADVHWMLTAGSGLLMNPVGSGKTISVLTWMRNLALDKVVLICPAAMKMVWADEARIWYPELEPIVVKGSAKERRDLIEEAGTYGGLCIINFESVRTHTRLAPYGQVNLSAAEKTTKDFNRFQWDAVIVDEAHRLADPKSKQTRACWAIGHDPFVKYRWALTATPTTKGLDTLWSPLHFTDPVEWPARSKFVDRYCTVATNFWGGVTIGAVKPDMEEEFLQIFKPRSRRLPKDIVLPQLPPLIPIKRMLDMDKEQAEAYRQMAELSLAEVEAGEVLVATSSAARYTRLGQFASSFARLEPKGDGTYSVELALPSNKIAAFLDDLEDWLVQEESVIVFATSRRLIELLSTILVKKKIKHAKIVGGQKEMERHEQKAMFQDGEVPVILVVIQAGGSGITLTRGRIMAFLQRSWSRVDDQQAEGRGHRIGSEIHESVIRVDYISRGTTDVGQLDVLASKDDIMQQVLRDKETIKAMILGQHLPDHVMQVVSE